MNFILLQSMPIDPSDVLNQAKDVTPFGTEVFGFLVTILFIAAGVGWWRVINLQKTVVSEKDRTIELQSQIQTAVIAEKDKTFEEQKNLLKEVVGVIKDVTQLAKDQKAMLQEMRKERRDDRDKTYEKLEQSAKSIRDHVTEKIQTLKSPQQ